MKKALKIYKTIVIETFKPVPLCLIKWWPFKVFAKLQYSLSLKANKLLDIVKDAVSGLGQILQLKAPFK